jgi:urea transport system permease protein
MLGPILGAVGINALKSHATHAYAEQWPYLLGGLFIFVTVFMPKGVIGLPEQFRDLKRRWTTRRERSARIVPVADRAPEPSPTEGP